jgi:signal transduction histidine kinase
MELYQQYHPQPHPAVQAELEAVDLNFLIDDLPKLLSSMRVGADRIQKIVLSLRNFSRMDEAEMKEVNLHDGIDSTLMILQSRLKAKSDRPSINVVKEYRNLPGIECYPGQLNQVFMNILSNAIDAVDERLERCLEQTETYTPTITIQTKLLNDNQVQIAIADNGFGIPEAAQRRLFDPFYTTKPVGKGTGMGLSISYQIVTEKHQGTLRCKSDLNQGSQFVVTIPLGQADCTESIA